MAQLDGWGRYGVYIFFVLSGASMYLAYDHKFAQSYSPARFILLRFARLAPLFMAVLVMKLAYSILLGRSLLDELSIIFLNTFFLFGMGNPGATSGIIGGWSLGIEFMFYLMFPVITAIVRRRAWLWMTALAFISQHIFVHTTLGGQTLESAWVPYTQLLSFIFYFVAGCTIGRLVRHQAWRRTRWAWMAFAACLLPLASLHGEGNLVGTTGLLLSLAAALVVLASAGLPIAGGMAKLADHLGKMSYGVYLLHPLIYMEVKNQAIVKASPVGAACLIVAASAILALLAERFYEAPLMRKIQGKLGHHSHSRAPLHATAT